NTHHPPSPLVHPPPLPPPTYFVSPQSGPLTFTPLITCPPLPCHLLSAALTSHCPLSPYVHAVCHVLIFSHPFSPFVTHTHSLLPPPFTLLWLPTPCHLSSAAPPQVTCSCLQSPASPPVLIHSRLDLCHPLPV